MKLLIENFKFPTFGRGSPLPLSRGTQDGKHCINDISSGIAKPTGLVPEYNFQVSLSLLKLLPVVLWTWARTALAQHLVLSGAGPSPMNERPTLSLASLQEIQAHLRPVTVTVTVTDFSPSYSPGCTLRALLRTCTCSRFDLLLSGNLSL